MNTITLGARPANPIPVPCAPPVPIPTALARMEREIAACDRIDDLVDTAMRVVFSKPSISPFADVYLADAANRRFTELRAKEQAA